MQAAKRPRCSGGDQPSCPVCYHEYRDQGEQQPLILECGHTLCKICVLESKFTACPICCKALSRPLGSIPPNYALMQTLVGSSAPGSVKELLARWELEAAARLLLCPEHLVLGDAIKQGASGTVRKATLEGKQVAVKVLKLPPINSAAIDSPQLSALKRELSVLLHITESCHHTCRYLGFTIKGEEFCIVMPLYPSNLADAIQQQGSGGLPLPRALSIAQDIARGLEELHGQGVAMLDLKPENVLLTAQGMAVLCDFGFSNVMDRSFGVAKVTQVAGTFNYMSPEQMEEGSLVGFQTDVWAWACTLIHMVTGQLPLAELNLMQIMRKVCMSKQAAAVPPGLPPHLKQLLSECLQFNPYKRPAAAEISQALRQAHEAPSAGGAAPGAPSPGAASQGCVNITLQDACGGEVRFTVKPQTLFSKILTAYSRNKGINEASVALVLDGARLSISSGSTVASLGVEDGDVVRVLVTQFGDIGQWQAAVANAGSLPASEQLLLDAANCPPLSADEVEHIIRTAHTPPLPSLLPSLPHNAEAGSGTPQLLPDLLSACQCTALMAHLDSQLRAFFSDHPSGDQLFDGQHGFAHKDFKLSVPRATLDSLTSPSISAAMESCGGQLLAKLGIPACATSLRFLLRRRAFTPNASPPERIPFHRDSSLVVVNVALNAGYQGGSLMFCVGERVLCPARPAGCGTAHDLTTVHGVSHLSAGVRYNLFAVFDAAQAA